MSRLEPDARIRFHTFAWDATFGFVGAVLSYPIGGGDDSSELELINKEKNMKPYDRPVPRELYDYLRDISSLEKLGARIRKYHLDNLHFSSDPETWQNMSVSDLQNLQAIIMCVAEIAEREED